MLWSLIGAGAPIYAYRTGKSVTYLYPADPGRVYLLFDFFYGLARASTMYAPVHILPALLFRSGKLLRDPFGVALKTAHATFLSSLFLTTYQFTVKASQAVLREDLFFGDQAWKACLSGLLTGLSCFFEKPTRVNELMLYCVPFSSTIMWNAFKANGYVRDVPGFEYGLIAAAASLWFANLRDLKPTYRHMTEFFVGEEAVDEEELEAAVSEARGAW